MVKSFWLKGGMPPGVLCSKCRQIAPAPGDTWCNSCSSWEFLGRELTASWDSAGARLLAGDICLNAARQAKALRSLSAGLARRAAEPGAGEHLRDREPENQPSRGHREGRESLPRRRSVRPKEEESEEQEETEEESRDKRDAKSPDHRPVRDAGPRPPEPDGPPPGHRDSGTRREPRPREASRREDREDRHSHHERRGEHKRRRGSTKQRGGRKHQRLHRLADNPTLQIHRKPSADLWELGSLRERPFELGNLGK